MLSSAPACSPHLMTLSKLVMMQVQHAMARPHGLTSRDEYDLDSGLLRI
jgi:hypothetical protein